MKLQKATYRRVAVAGALACAPSSSRGDESGLSFWPPRFHDKKLEEGEIEEVN